VLLLALVEAEINLYNIAQLQVCPGAMKKGLSKWFSALLV
jgi:hypothetical protein